MSDTSPSMFRNYLEQELETSVLPKIDVNSASPEDVIRDMHRVLAGNGGPGRGLIFKVASTNAHVKCLDEKLEVTRRTIAERNLECIARHSKIDRQLGNVDAVLWRRFFTFLWNNKGGVIAVMIIILQLLWFVNVRSQYRGAATDSNDIKQAVALLSELSKLQLERDYMYDLDRVVMEYEDGKGESED